MIRSATVALWLLVALHVAQLLDAHRVAVLDALTWIAASEAATIVLVGILLVSALVILRETYLRIAPWLWMQRESEAFDRHVDNVVHVRFPRRDDERGIGA